MLGSKAISDLTRLLPGQVRFNEPMKLHTTWRIGGPADIFVEPKGQDYLIAALAFAQQKELPVTVVGNGSNLLVKDGGIRGLVIKIGAGFAQLEIRGNCVVTGAGTNLAFFTKVAKEAGVGGFEFLTGIPGTIGGAIVMNAGAYGKEISNICSHVTLLNEMGQVNRIPAGALGFGYRTSKFLRSNKLIVLQAVFQGVCREPRVIWEEMENILSKRKKTQPLGYPCAGSVFKNPPKMSAGYLIEQVGAKGMRVGGAVISDLHANFIVNLGNATANDVLMLIEQVKKLVLERYAVALETEVCLLGEE